MKHLNLLCYHTLAGKTSGESHADDKKNNTIRCFFQDHCCCSYCKEKHACHTKVFGHIQRLQRVKECVAAAQMPQGSYDCVLYLAEAHCSFGFPPCPCLATWLSPNLSPDYTCKANTSVAQIWYEIGYSFMKYSFKLTHAKTILLYSISAQAWRRPNKVAS